MPSEIIVEHVQRRPETGPWPSALDTVLSPAMAEEAAAEITTWPGYDATPLRSLDALAAELGIGALYYKDEGERFGLGSFKALGGAYAVLRVAADWLTRHNGTRTTLAAIREGRHAADLAGLTVVTATDGNHGRSVAWGARMAGCRCRIYIHAGVSQGRQTAMEAFGAEVVRISGDYDESLHLCAAEAAENGWVIVSDTSFPGYMDLPRHVMAGYTVMASEVLDQLGSEVPTHVFVQAGVGGVAAAVCARMWQRLGARRPCVVVVEPSLAPCVLESARNDRPMTVAIEDETLMAGLSCGEASLLAWEVLSRGAAHYLTIGEEQVVPVMRRLASGSAGNGPIVAGESAVAGLIGLMGAAAAPVLREAMGLDADSRVVVFGCEGATDPELYRRLIDGTGA